MHTKTPCKEIMRGHHARPACKDISQDCRRNSVLWSQQQAVEWLSAVQDLTSLSVAQQNKSEAGRKRWDRNISVEGHKRLGHAEGFAQRAHRSARLSGNSVLQDGPYVSAQCSQSLATAPLPDDTVLTFTVHRFDRLALLCSIALLLPTTVVTVVDM